jgi:hypothetical protein
VGAIGTQSEYARHRKAKGLPGGSPVAVLKAIRAGRISVLADGKIDFGVADIQWEQNTRKRADLIPEQRPTDATAPSTGWSDHKARKEAAEASLREIELEKRRGELIDRRGAELAAQKTARTLRDALLDTLPSKISLELAALTDPWAIECKIREAIRGELHAIVAAMTETAEHA